MRHPLVSACVVALALALVVPLLPGCGGKPGSRSAGLPNDADFCNVLLVPSVAEKIGLDLPTRILAATKGARLLRELRGGTPHTPMMSSASPVADRFGAGMVERAGREAREMLPADARKSFEISFAAGALVRVGFWTEPNDSGTSRDDRFFVTYGWYDEEKARVGQKSLRACEKELNDSYRWISSPEQADFLLDHEEEDVRKAAEKWWRKNEGRPAREPALRRPSATAFARSVDEAAGRTEAARERAAAQEEAAAREWAAAREAAAARAQATARERAAAREEAAARAQATVRERAAAQEEAAARAEAAARERAAAREEAAASRQREEEARARRTAERAAEREAFRERVRAEQEAVRKRIEEQRRASR